MDHIARAESARRQTLIIVEMLTLYYHATDPDPSKRRQARSLECQQVYIASLQSFLDDKIKDAFEYYLEDIWRPVRGDVPLGRQLSVVADLFEHYPAFSYGYNVFLPPDYDLVSGYSGGNSGLAIRKLDDVNNAIFVRLHAGSFSTYISYEIESVSDFVQHSGAASICRYHTPHSHGSQSAGSDEVVQSTERRTGTRTINIDRWVDDTNNAVIRDGESVTNGVLPEVKITAPRSSHAAGEPLTRSESPANDEEAEVKMEETAGPRWSSRLRGGMAEKVDENVKVSASDRDNTLNKARNGYIPAAGDEVYFERALEVVTCQANANRRDWLYRVVMDQEGLISEIQREVEETVGHRQELIKETAPLAADHGGKRPKHRSRQKKSTRTKPCTACKNINDDVGCWVCEYLYWVGELPKHFLQRVALRERTQEADKKKYDAEEKTKKTSVSKTKKHKGPNSGTVQ